MLECGFVCPLELEFWGFCMWHFLKLVVRDLPRNSTNVWWNTDCTQHRRVHGDCFIHLSNRVMTHCLYTTLHRRVPGDCFIHLSNRVMAHCLYTTLHRRVHGDCFIHLSNRVMTHCLYTTLPESWGCMMTALSTSQIGSWHIVFIPHCIGGCMMTALSTSQIGSWHIVFIPHYLSHEGAWWLLYPSLK